MLLDDIVVVDSAVVVMVVVDTDSVKLVEIDSVADVVELGLSDDVVVSNVELDDAAVVADNCELVVDEADGVVEDPITAEEDRDAV